MARGMIRYLRALAWLRWHLVVNSLRPTRKRDALERASRALQVLGPVLVFLFIVPAILILGFAGLAGGWLLGTSDQYLDAALTVLRVLLVFEFILTLLAPLLRATQGAPPNLVRFLLLPIPSRFLYLGEAFSSFGDPWLAILASGLIGLGVGWGASGSVGGALLVLAAGAAVLALLAGLGALATSFTHLVFRDRRRGELVSLVVLLLISAGGMMPALFSAFQTDGKAITVKVGGARERRAAPPAAGAPAARTRDDRALPPWSVAYPPELYARCVGLACRHRTGSALLPLAVLLLWAAGVHGVGSRVYRRLLESPEVQSSRRKGSPPRWVRIPGLSPAASAVAVAEVKLIFRTVQGKVALFLAPLMVVVLAVVLTRGPRELLGSNPPVPMGVILAFASIAFSLMTLESCLLNQFAMDRAGLTLEFLAPVSDRDLIRGKAAGAALLASSRALLCYIVALIAVPGGSPFYWLAALAGGAAVFLLLAPGGAIVSVLLPKTMDLGRLGQAGKPNPFASFLGMLLIVAGAAPAAALALLAAFLLRSGAVAFLLVASWTLVAAAIAVPLFRLAERLLARRRENLALVAQGR